MTLVIKYFRCELANRPEASWKKHNNNNLVFEIWLFKILWILKKKSSQKMCNVLKRVFWVLEFFFAIFSFWDMVDFVFNIPSELGTWRYFCESGSETLTSDTNWLMGFNPKVSGVWGRSPCGWCRGRSPPWNGGLHQHNFFFWIRLRPRQIHYECLVQNRSYLEN